MSFDNPELPDHQQIEQEAAEWFVKRDCGLTESEENDYQAWLSGDARRILAMRKHEQTWARFAPLEAKSRDIEEFPEAMSPDMPVQQGRSFLPLISSLAAVIVLGISLWALSGNNSASSENDFEGRFVAAAYETRILRDGTILELNRGARMKVTFDRRSRNVWLHAGEAHFHVAKDENRPFVVYAGNTQVQAIGTAFNVLVSDSSVEVLVTEGTINFRKAQLKKESNQKESSFSRDMDAGQFTTLSLQNADMVPEVESVNTQQLSNLLSWKPETLEFRSTPLGDVVNAFNKRNDIQLVLADEQLETMPIEATFRSNNVLAFARLLEMTFDLEMERPSQNEIVLRYAN